MNISQSNTEKQHKKKVLLVKLGVVFKSSRVCGLRLAHCLMSLLGVILICVCINHTQSGRV